MNGLQCEKCGHALALADASCGACGTVIPIEQRLSVLIPRADALAESERFADAARALDPALALALSSDQAKTLWRKKGVWLRKASIGQAQYLDSAEAALGEALRLDDSDDLSHQIWIDLLVQRGFSEKARAWYQQRLQLNPDDSIAKRQMSVLKLAADFKTKPRPESSLNVSAEPENFIWRMVVPSPVKTWVTGLTGMLSFVLAISFAFSRSAPAPVVAAPVDADLASAVAASPVQLLSSLNDPWMWCLNGLISAAYVYWAYSRRKNRKRG